MIQLNIGDRREDGMSIGLEPVLAALLHIDSEITVSATILGGGFPQGPNAGRLGHAIEDDGPQTGLALANIRRWMQDGEIVDDIHLWNEAVALGRFDSGDPYVIASQATIDRLISSFESTTMSTPAPVLLAPNEWG